MTATTGRQRARRSCWRWQRERNSEGRDQRRPDNRVGPLYFGSFAQRLTPTGTVGGCYAACL